VPETPPPPSAAWPAAPPVPAALGGGLVGLSAQPATRVDAASTMKPNRAGTDIAIASSCEEKRYTCLVNAVVYRFTNRFSSIFFAKSQT
jgi:hypothetical protein